MNKTLQTYYTNSDLITDYMVSKLELCDTDTILEPSVGEGVFVDKILQQKPKLSITTYDIDNYSYQVMSRKFRKNQNVSIHESDTLIDLNLDIRANTHTGFSKIIGNPPYGAVFTDEQKRVLSKKYSRIYSKDSYVLFLFRCLSLLEEDGKLVFIIPDTFLYLNMHKKFREFLFKNYLVEEIAIFPSKWFPGVSFAYSKLSIITITNRKQDIFENSIKIFDTLSSEIDFSKINCGVVKPKEIKQTSILKQENYNLHLNATADEILMKSNLTLGDIADCVTGIYTGDNKKYLKVKSLNIRNSKGYACILDEEINLIPATVDGITDSIANYIPIIKGSMKQGYKQPNDDWFIRWDKSTINEYHTFKKARFQNSDYYFKYGIATPMLKSKKIKATIMKNRVFDQSIVGIFPKDSRDTLFVLGLLNSNIVNEIVHNINPTVNNSANYLKRIPIPKISDESKKQIDSLVEGILYRDENNQRKLDKIISNLYLSN
ncbi:Eco57I restriction-modification methylase domain-containing protein [Carnobacteriaceae bacterium zg-C25]|nr:Eco57I restriction-modification methylase domain-containing protein [Carnobacteriaceae bacterium zg-C25]